LKIEADGRLHFDLLLKSEYMIVAILAFLGLALIYLEFFLPTGLSAVFGAIVLIGSVVYFSVNTPELFFVLIYVVSMLIMVFMICKLALWQIERKKNSLYLDQDQEGFQASFFDKTLIGKTGVCLSDLKPSGHISLDSESYQAVSKAGYLSKGTSIIVIGGQGAYVFVQSHTQEKT